MDIFPTLSEISSVTSRKTVKAISLVLVEFSQSTLYPPQDSCLSLRSEKVAPVNKNSYILSLLAS